MTATPPRPAAGQAPSLEVPPDLVTSYANLVRIAHSPSELVFDFAQLLPGVPNARVTSRIVMSPMHAKLFYRALGENLSRFESAFGEIHLPGEATLADYLFRPPQQPPGSHNPPKDN
jgi:hypothetical protein